jgi:protein-S-isoprenylcysteine O-methyltransferase Ste14
MISKLVLTIPLLLLLTLSVVITRAVIKKQQIIGRPPIPVVYFLLAKMLVAVNLTFLLLKGLNIKVTGLFVTVPFSDVIALVFLVTGTVVLLLSTFKLNKDLVFGLSSSKNHQLQTKGIYSVSRHPFYLGFILILFSSCLFNPHFLNILSFAGAWIIHHFIMIKEEQFLAARYGDEYIQYTKRVKRYVSF